MGSFLCYIVPVIKYGQVEQRYDWNVMHTDMGVEKLPGRNFSDDLEGKTILQKKKNVKNNTRKKIQHKGEISDDKVYQK